MKLLILTFLIFLVSCGNSLEFKEDPSARFRGSFEARDVTFSQIKGQILQNNCIQCHPGYDSYETVFSERNKIVDAVLTDRMPKNAPALNDNLKRLLVGWVRAGAPAGNIPPGSGSDELVATWNSISKKIVFPKCVQCHNPNGQASFMDLSTRQKFFEEREYLLNNFEDVENSYLFEILNDPEEPMPPVWSGIDRLSEEEMKVIKVWIEKGLP